MNQRAKTAMAAALACVTLVTSAVAEESPYRKSLTERSKKEGFGRAEAKTLSVVVTSDRGKTAERLRKEASSGTLGKLLALSFDKPSQNGKKTVSFVAEQGYLQVYADGSRFRLRGDLGKVKPTEANGGKERIEIHRLEKIARDYVQGPLKEFIGLQDAEALTFLGSRYFRQGGGSVAGDKGKEYLVANIAILGREIHGIPVVGSGSKIAVWLTPEAEVVGVDVDWPQYERGEKAQPLLSVEELRRRIAAASVPVEDTEKVKVVRFECGYVDLGATRRLAGAPVQQGAPSLIAALKSMKWRVRSRARTSSPRRSRSILTSAGRSLILSPGMASRNRANPTRRQGLRCRSPTRRRTSETCFRARSDSRIRQPPNA